MSASQQKNIKSALLYSLTDGTAFKINPFHILSCLLNWNFLLMFLVLIEN